MNQKQVVKEACLRIRDRWWDVLPFEQQSCFGVSGREGEPLIMVFVETSPEALMRGIEGDRLSLTLSNGDEDEPTHFDSLGFFDTRKLMKAIRFAKQRQAVMEQTRSHLQKKLGRDPTDEEICKAAGWDLDTFHW